MKENKKIKKFDKPLSFYIYRWDREFTTFLIAQTPAAALAIIEKSREIACPPELQGEILNKKQLKKADPDFILTINSPEILDDEVTTEETSERSYLN